MDRLERLLGHGKQNRIKSRRTPPSKAEGRDGDMCIHNSALYIKDRGLWVCFNSHNETATGEATSNISENQDGFGGYGSMNHSDLGNINANQHHPKIHTYDSHTGEVPAEDLPGDGRWNASADSGDNDQVNLGDVFDFEGGEGIDTTMGTSKVTIAAEDATYTNKGVCQFALDDFTVTAGAVVIGAQGVDNAQLKNMAANTVKVRDANTSGVPSDVEVANAELLIGDGTGFNGATLSNDITMDNTGDCTINDVSVEEAMMADDSIESRAYVNDSIDDEHINWAAGGTTPSALEVSADDVPVEDANSYWDTNNVESALDAIGGEGIVGGAGISSDYNDVVGGRKIGLNNLRVDIDLSSVSPCLDFNADNSDYDGAMGLQIVTNRTDSNKMLLKEESGVAIDESIDPTWTSLHKFHNQIHVSQGGLLADGISADLNDFPIQVQPNSTGEIFASYKGDMLEGFSIIGGGFHTKQDGNDPPEYGYDLEFSEWEIDP